MSGKFKAETYNRNEKQLYFWEKFDEKSCRFLSVVHFFGEIHYIVKSVVHMTTNKMKTKKKHISISITETVFRDKENCG